MGWSAHSHCRDHGLLRATRDLHWRGAPLSNVRHGVGHRTRRIGAASGPLRSAPLPKRGRAFRGGRPYIGGLIPDAEREIH